MSNIVVDVGSYTTKFGNAGEEIPQQFRSCAYKPRHLPAMMAALSDAQQSFFKESQEEQLMLNVDAAGLYTIRPLFNNRGQSDEIPQLVDFVIKSMQLESIQKATILMPLNTPTKQQKKIMQQMFEQNDVQSLQLTTGGAFGLYASGRVEGLFLSVGDTQTFVQPVLAGQAPTSSSYLSFIGGRAVTNQLQQELYKNSIQQIGFDPRSSFFNSQYDHELLDELKLTNCKCQSLKLKQIKDLQQITYKLPDNTEIQFPAQTTFNAAEVLFTPTNFQPSVTDLIQSAISDTPLALQGRLLRNIVISGGGSQLQGFDQRLAEELGHFTGAELLGSVKNRDLQQWQGASACALLSGFSGQFLSRQRWLEEGV